MATRSDAALSTLLLTSRIADVEAPALSSKEYWALTRQVEQLDTLFGRTSNDIASSFDIEPERAEQIVVRLSGATQLAFELERLDRQGYVVLTPFDDDYPRRLVERLGDQAPPSITAVGSVELLGTEGIGLVGSRNATDEAIGIAETIAAAAAGRGSSVVSGGARGIDQRSMAAAYQAGGSVVGWLAESLEKRLRDPETRRVVSDGQVCLATPFKPDAGFSVANAMSRNKLIYASARVTLVVACDPGKGGTWEGAVESIRKSYGTVAVWAGSGAGPGNEALLVQGGQPVSAVEELFDAQPLSVKPQRPSAFPRALAPPSRRCFDPREEGRIVMCLTCGCMQAHLEMGEKNIRYEDVKAAADENGRSVAETLDIVDRTVAIDREDHPEEYASS